MDFIALAPKHGPMNRPTKFIEHKRERKGLKTIKMVNFDGVGGLYERYRVF